MKLEYKSKKADSFIDLSNWDEMFSRPLWVHLLTANNCSIQHDRNTFMHVIILPIKSSVIVSCELVRFWFIEFLILSLLKNSAFRLYEHIRGSRKLALVMHKTFCRDGRRAFGDGRDGLFLCDGMTYRKLKG